IHHDTRCRRRPAFADAPPPPRWSCPGQAPNEQGHSRSMRCKVRLSTSVSYRHSPANTAARTFVEARSAPALQGKNPVDQVLYLVHVLRWRGLHDLVLLLVAVRKFRLFSGGEVLDQACLRVVFAAVFLRHGLVCRTVLFLLDGVAFE